jgi:hypothetical protein
LPSTKSGVSWITEPVLSKDVAMLRRSLCIVVGLMIEAGVANSHVAPSVDDNNRYIKVTPLSDRVRIAYTIFMGEVPGAAARKNIDANHDGTIDDAEGQAYGLKLAGEVGGNLELLLDGVATPVVWSTVSVGMGSSDTKAGSFSIDLIAWPCLLAKGGAGGDAHSFVLRDRFALMRPGETEIKIEDSLGIAVNKAALGSMQSAEHDYRVAGAATVLASDGLVFDFSIGPDAPASPDGTCQSATAGRQGLPAILFIMCGALFAAIAAAITMYFHRRAQRKALAKHS